MPRVKIIGVCSVEDCVKPLDSKGLCKNHYMRQYKFGRLHLINTGEKSNHPHYGLWTERKLANALSEEWLDFLKFAKDIGNKPEGNYRLLRLDGSKPFGSDNFIWVKHLKREEGESKKDWIARKWKTRQLANPGMETDRSLRRKYNLTLAEYNEKLKSQNYVCAICEEPEKSFSSTGSLKKLAVDHCHTSEGIRDLLCWRCNGALGKVNDSVELLQKMIDYLNKHKET